MTKPSMNPTLVAFAFGESSMRIAAMIGIGRYAITVELPSTGGLYKNSNVTYRGQSVGVVKAVVDLVRYQSLYLANNTVLLVVTGVMIATLALLADLVVRSRHGV